MLRLRGFRKLTWIFASVLLATCFFLLTSGVVADERSRSETTGVDVLILVDASDSMNTLDKDRMADKVTRSMVEDLLTLLPGDTTSRLGIICFTVGIEPLSELTPLSEVWLEDLQFKCERKKGTGTKFPELLQEALSVFKTQPRPENRKIIILITDGHPSAYPGSLVKEDADNRDYLRSRVAPQIDTLEKSEESPALFVIGVANVQYKDFWKQHSNFTLIEKTDDLVKLDKVLLQLVPVAPTPSPTPTQTSTPVATPSPTLTPTSTPVATPSPTPTQTSTSVPTPSLTSTPTSTPVATPSPTPTQTSIPVPTPSLTPTLTPSPIPTSTPTSTSTPMPIPTRALTPTATATPDESIIGITGANRNLGVGVFLGFLVLILALLFVIAPRLGAYKAARLAGELAKQHREMPYSPEDSSCIEMMDTGTELMDEIRKLVEACFSDPTVAESMFRGFYSVSELADRIQDLKPDSNGLDPLSMIVAAGFSVVWNNPDTYMLGFKLLDIILCQSRDKEVMKHFLQQMRKQEKLPDDIKQCVKFFERWARETVVASNIDSFLEEATNETPTEPTLHGLRNYGIIGEDWLGMFETLKQSNSATSFSDAVQHLREFKMSLNHFAGLMLALEKLGELASRGTPGTPEFDELNEKAKRAIQGLSHFQREMIETIFHREEWQPYLH